MHKEENMIIVDFRKRSKKIRKVLKIEDIHLQKMTTRPTVEEYINKAETEKKGYNGFAKETLCT